MAQVGDVRDSTYEEEMKPCIEAALPERGVHDSTTNRNQSFSNSRCEPIGDGRYSVAPISRSADAIYSAGVLSVPAWADGI